MLQMVSSNEILQLMMEEHPQWADAYRKKMAEEIALLLDPIFDKPLKVWIKSRKMTNVCYGEFDLVTIKNIHPESAYLDLILFLDAYIKDPVKGKLQIIKD